MPSELPRQSAPEWLGGLYGIAAAVHATGALIVVVQGDKLRAAVIGLGVPLWTIAWELRRG